VHHCGQQVRQRLAGACEAAANGSERTHERARVSRWQRQVRAPVRARAPVSAMPIRSRPSSAMGQPCDWMGVGSSKRARLTSSST
jgi:hypothetical protein